MSWRKKTDKWPYMHQEATQESVLLTQSRSQWSVLQLHLGVLAYYALDLRDSLSEPITLPSNTS